MVDVDAESEVVPFSTSNDSVVASVGLTSTFIKESFCIGNVSSALCKQYPPL